MTYFRISNPVFRSYSLFTISSMHVRNMSGLYNYNHFIGGRWPPVSEHISQGTSNWKPFREGTFPRNPGSQGTLFNLNPLRSRANQVLFEKYKESNFSYPRMSKIFPSLVVNCQMGPLIKEPPMNPLKDDQSLQEFLSSVEADLKKLQEILQEEESETIQEDSDTIMKLGFNGFPYFLNYNETRDVVLYPLVHSFPITPRVIKKMTTLWESLNMGEYHLPASSSSLVGLNQIYGFNTYSSRVIGDLVGPSIKDMTSSFIGKTRALVEAFIHYKGEYNRVLVLISLGVGCTVWYTVSTGLAGMTLPLSLFPVDAEYAMFCKDDFVHPKFMKFYLVEREDIMNKVLMGFETVHPFSKIELPTPSDYIQVHDSSGASTSGASGSTSEASVGTSQAGWDNRCAVSLGLMIAVFVATNVIAKEAPKLIEMTI